MADDLRHRYAEAIHDALFGRFKGSTSMGLAEGAADAVMAVRDQDLQALRERAETAEQTVAHVRAEIEAHAECEEWCCESTPKILAALDTKEDGPHVEP